MSKEEWIENNRKTLEDLYYELYMECITDKDAELESVLCTMEAALEDIGILEIPFDDEEENEADHRDEWCLTDREMEE